MCAGVFVWCITLHVPVAVLPIQNRLAIGTNVLRALRPVIETTLIACDKRITEKSRTKEYYGKNKNQGGLTQSEGFTVRLISRTLCQTVYPSDVSLI